MKRTIKSAAVSIFFILLLAGCYKDKGNYDYKTVNSLTITADVPNTVSVLLQDTLRINTTIVQTINSSSGLEYEWVLYLNNGTPVTRWKLGTSQNLSAQIVQAPGQYILDYFVKDKSTGVSFRKSFTVNVVSKFNEGWLVIEEDASACDLTMITPTDAVFRNIYSSANNGARLPIGSHRINIVRDRNNIQKIFVMSPAELTQPYFADFLKVASFNDMFWGPPATKKPQEYFIQGTFNEMLLNNGLPHGFSTVATPAPYKLGAEPAGIWDLEPYEMFGSSVFIFYDKVSQRFYKYDLTNLLPFAAPPPTAVFNVNNVKKKLLFAGANTGSFFDCLFKNNTNDSLFVFRLNGALAQPAVDSVYIPNTAAPGLLTATKFVNSRLLPHLYYVSDNKVYLLDIPARQSRVVYTFPTGTVATSMKMYINLRNSADPNHNRLIGISTMESGAGKVYTFPIAATGDFTGSTYSKVYTGFGKINDIIFKWAP